MSYQVCGHCDQLLSDKTLKEHRRLYFEDGSWIRDDVESDGSSLLSLSLPRSNGSYIELNSNGISRSDAEEEVTDDEMLFPDFFQVNQDDDNFNGVEHWNERDLDLDEDFVDNTEPPPLPKEIYEEIMDETLNEDEFAIIWWLVAFTCLFQSLHSLSSKAIAWLLKFLSALLVFFGRYSEIFVRIGSEFPGTLYQRTQYLNKRLFIPSTCNYVVCHTCHALFKYKHCIEKRAHRVFIRLCSTCRNRTPLLMEIVTSSGSRKYYPYLVFPSACLISSLESLFSRSGFYKQCEHWRQDYSEQCFHLSDVYCGKMWKNFLQVDGESFLESPNSIALMLNIDWFQPFKHRTYSVGVVYLAIMNLPRAIRFKRENIIIVGLIPGPSEPSLNLNTYLTPMVSDLLTLWDGVNISTKDKGNQIIRCALLCVGCDLPAGRKTCGFLSYTANIGCSRCYCNFGTGVFGKQNYSGFDRENWKLRSNDQHRKDVKAIQQCHTKSERQRAESKFGCRYSSLLQLPYFDAVHMLIIDPMHNLYLGTAKYIFSKIWVDRGGIDSESLKMINERILTLNVPPEVSFNRLPACMQYPASLTAEQWMLWVNYYSLYCLYEIIPQADLECWRHFVLASRLLCKQTITSVDIKIADALLIRFCQRYQVLYGEEFVTPNIHLHAHLTACIEDYGPMSSFWLFSFERFNGILGDEPTNNRSIEIQLMARFIEDNSHFQLMSSIPNASSDVTNTFSHVVVEYACSYTSTKHLDVMDSKTDGDFLPALKYVFSSFCEAEMQILYHMYCDLYPSHFESSDGIYLPQSYKKMSSFTIKGQKLKSGQYILAKNVYPFSNSSSSSPVNVASPVVYHNARPAKVDYFIMHSVQFGGGDYINYTFAAISWPMRHPLQYCLGKPYEVWCLSSFETCSKNFIVPLRNFITLLLTAQQTLHDQHVLITVPLII